MGIPSVARLCLATASLLVITAISAPVAAQQKRDPSYTVTLNQDNFFGFNPSFSGLMPVSDKVDFSFYGTFWTRPSFGVGGAGGNLWTEFGVGANFNLDDGRLRIKPQIGITNGSLLSGGARATRNGPGLGSNFGDGIVPSLTVNYSDDKVEAEYYGGYYAALANRNSTGSLDFLHTWVNIGYKASSLVSFGPHYEILSNTRAVGGRANKTYEWLGGYVQFTLPKGFFARFTAGADLDSNNRGDFYKMSAGMTF